MNSTGSPEAAPSGRRGWGAIALALILVVIATVIAVQVLGMLYAVLFPPAPPVLEG